uniref:Ubiquitin-conjugating enzyme E2 Z n=1 Tax=Bionectria ochroleuca TaxID=29856 RepID=A0A8H7TQV5_BIOOC
MDQSILRISKELSELQKGSDLSLAVACRDIDVRNVKALIIGPHETPYEFGFFEFAIKFNKDYPSKAPHVTCVTTNNGRTRFNPNIYASGKVCLSILGTWRGESGEQWSSAQGLESILLSIQSLLSANPYENEPGFERPRAGDDEKRERKAYAQKIHHETLRLSVIKRLEDYLHITAEGKKINPSNDKDQDLYDDAEEVNVPFEPFKDLCKRRFLWYYESYLDSAKKGSTLVRPKQLFASTPFESKGNNIMDGSFDYPDLERRLNNIKKALDEETESWAREGLESTAEETTVSVNLKHQFEQVVATLKGGDMPHNVSLEDGNPFVWILTYFGRPMTHFDSGLLRIRINFSPRFPEEQPRVKFETRIFHHLVAPDGTICYSPKPNKKEDVMSHVEAIISALEEDEPAYDPRKIVNLEANKLFWNGEKDGKKLYHRRLRRSVQDSTEEFPV